MALAHSPSVVTNGIVFYYDMNNPQKSWKGAPTTNLTPDLSIGAIQAAPTATYVGVEDGWKKYSLNGTWTAGTYPYSLGIGAAAFTGGVTYSSSVFIKTNVPSKFASLFTGMNYVNEPMNNGGTSFSITQSDGSIYVGRSGFQYTNTTTQTGYLISQPIIGQVFNGATDFVYTKNGQVEVGTFPTPFVAGTRFANNNLESTPSFPSWNATAGSSASGGTLTFSGGSYNSKSSWDLYKTYSGLTAGVNYTWSALVKSGTASNLIVTMNNASAWNTGPGEVFAGFSSTEWRRIYITGTTNTGSFNIHLGASFNNDLQNIVQTGGTIFIQDVSLRLTNSQTAISDVTGNNSAIAGNLVYNSDGTFQFSYANPSYIQIPNSFLNKTEGTMNFWVYPTRYNGGNGYFVNREDSTANATDWFWIGPYSDSFYFRLGNGSDCCSNDLSFGSVSSVIPLNTWTNMCFTWKINGTSAIYKNGALYTSRSIGNIPNTNPASNGRIGLGHGNADDYFNGIMPIVSIYNRQLSANEINQNFNAQRGRYGI
jgi:hypothetical protein